MELKPMATLPETGFLRLPQIVGDPKAYPPTRRRWTGRARPRRRIRAGTPVGFWAGNSQKKSLVIIVRGQQS